MIASDADLPTSSTEQQLTEQLSAQRKASLINRDGSIFGTFAEIGAGQEVVRYFFRTPGASTTIAKTISAYDMTFSDEIYGKTGRYVSRDRLMSMLDHEYSLLLQRLSEKKGTNTKFFAFADTVTARSQKGTPESHGWLGVRFQTEPFSKPNDIIIHVRMLDSTNILQQQALGIVGVNLLYAAFFNNSSPDELIGSLVDDLSTTRIEIDMIECHGDLFKDFDPRILSLTLLLKKLTNAIMIDASGKILQPSEVLRNKPILIERGSFGPVNKIHLDMLDSAKAMFSIAPKVKENDCCVLAEVSLTNIARDRQLDIEDLLARIDLLSATGVKVLISDYPEFYKIVGYLKRYTREPVGLVVGVNTLLQVLNEKHYENLDGGILEALGRMFKHDVSLYVYPMTKVAFKKYLAVAESTHNTQLTDPNSLENAGNIIDAINLPLNSTLAPLHQYLQTQNFIIPIVNYKNELLEITPSLIGEAIRENKSGWQSYLPGGVAELIKKRKMFGYSG